MGPADPPTDSDECIVVQLPARRTAGLLRAVVSLSLGTVLLLLALHTFGELNFRSSAFSNRVTDFAWAFLMLCVAVVAAGVLLAGLRWLLFLLWPATLGVALTPHQIDIRLGPFGRRQLRLTEITAQYRFERNDGDEQPLSTEDFMDPEVEIATCLPLLRHPQYPVPLNDILRQYIRGTEEEWLAAFGPAMPLFRRPQIEDCKGT